MIEEVDCFNLMQINTHYFYVRADGRAHVCARAPSPSPLRVPFPLRILRTPFRAFFLLLAPSFHVLFRVRAQPHFHARRVPFRAFFRAFFRVPFRVRACALLLLLFQSTSQSLSPPIFPPFSPRPPLSVGGFPSSSHPSLLRAQLRGVELHGAGLLAWLQAWLLAWLQAWLLAWLLAQLLAWLQAWLQVFFPLQLELKQRELKWLELAQQLEQWVHQREQEQQWLLLVLVHPRNEDEHRMRTQQRVNTLESIKPSS